MGVTRGKPDAKPPHLPGGLRLFVVFWTAFTAFYVVVIARRIVLDGGTPGLATVAGVGAVIAVWLYLYDVYRNTGDNAAVALAGRVVKRRIVLSLVLTIVVLANVTLVLQAVRNGEEFPLLRALLTFPLMLIVRHTLIHSSGATSHPRS